ncbi:MAG: GDSL-type esterase/lipase family protein [Candidatus Omnitrophota bacterium]
MKRLFLIALVLIAFSLSGCGPSIKNADSQGTQIICFGDSITFGQGAKKGGDYPAYLREMVKRDVINEGISGETTEEGLDRIEEDVLERDPYLVIIEFGANDYFKKVPQQETLDNLEQMVSRVQGEGAMVAVCDISGGAIMGAYNIYHKELKRLARRKGAIFIPYLMKGILQDPSLKSDQIHPNAEGYKIIAKRVYEAIEPYL